ncbi:MAG: helix-hairpin-helix domain-containing protein [Pseudolactococcus laudensis]
MHMKMIIAQLKEHLKLVIGVSIVLILVVFFWLKSTTNRIEDSPILSDKISVPEQNAQPNSKKLIESQKSEINKQIMVDIKGAVKKPAVYKVNSNARVNDVITLAGGLTSQADGKSINLAQKVTDEMIIYVASVGENVTAVPSSSPTDKAINEQGKAVTTTSDKVNINTADIAQLQTLKGIGAKKAQDILDYREQNGPFKTPEELGKVSGFGEKTIEKLRESITVD